MCALSGFAGDTTAEFCNACTVDGAGDFYQTRKHGRGGIEVLAGLFFPLQRGEIGLIIGIESQAISSKCVWITAATSGFPNGIIGE